MSIDLITGFGWLVLKHPNLLEPNTDKLYAKYSINKINYNCNIFNKLKKFLICFVED